VRDDSDDFIASTHSKGLRIPMLKQPKERVMVNVNQVSKKSSTTLAELNAMRLLSCSKETLKPEF
jgi:hypothetical protein